MITSSTNKTYAPYKAVITGDRDNFMAELRRESEKKSYLFFHDFLT